MSALLVVDSLAGGYSKAAILRDISLEVRAGEIVALFGANGAGKTSLLRGVTGALPVCRGTVTLAGRHIERLPVWSRAQLGLVHVPEGRHVFGPMTVRENLDVGAMAGRRHGRATADAAREQRERLFELFPVLEERSSQRAATLSGGEQQMLALARALMSAPDVILIDEMSAGLAPVMMQRLVDGLTAIRTTGVSVLLVEQAPQLVAGIVDRAYLVEQGRIVRHGTIEELGGSTAIAAHYLGVSERMGGR